jgi:hypothetical protein
MSGLSLVAKSGVLTNLWFRIVHHFNRFLFRRLMSLPNSALHSGAPFDVSLLTRCQMSNLQPRALGVVPCQELCQQLMSIPIRFRLLMIVNESGFPPARRTLSLPEDAE